MFTNSETTSILTFYKSCRAISVIDGTIPTEVQYNTNVIAAGPGIAVDKSVPNKIRIDNANVGYQLLPMFEGFNATKTMGTKITSYDPNNATVNGIYVRLKPFTNMMRVPLSSTVASDNINIYIDDTLTRWSEGQVLKLVFDSNLNMDGNNINIWTNKLGPWEQVATLYGSELTSKPYIEIVCTDKTNLTFATDVLR